MFDDQDATPPKHEVVLGEDLYGMSVVELQERVEALKAEIGRVEAELSTKQSGRAAAESVFSR